jgi:O-methyltransferase
MGFLRNKIWAAINTFLTQRHASLLYYRDPAQVEVMNLVRRIKTETKMLLWEPEAYQIFVLVRSLSNVAGDIAEIGTFKGGSTKLIATAAPQKHIYGFDSFEGLPEVDTQVDATRFTTGQYATSYEQVRAYLSEFPNVSLYQGFFPGTSGSIKDKIFSFVHLDVDLYQSTKESLEFFYTRMQKGGVILSHDYSTAKGVHQAFDEFFADKPESVIELMSSQCMVVKQ